MKRLRIEQLICLLLAGGLVGVSFWAVFQPQATPQENAGLKSAAPPAPALAMSPALAQALPQAWVAPQPSARGVGRGVDLFTPPAIDYNAATATHRMETPFEGAVRQRDPQAVPAAEPVLLEVKHEACPLQLTGFVGEGAQARGIFENRENGETLLLQAGDRVASLGIEIAEFQVQRTAVNIPESMTVSELRASALIRTREGETRPLQQGVIAPGSTLVAVVAFAGERHELREGAILLHGAITYRIAKIRLAPRDVVVTKENAADGSKENLVLNVQPPTGSTQP